MEEKFICKIASPEEMDRKWDYEIENNSDDRDNWITWKAEAISGRLSGVSLPYYGILDGNIICEATAFIHLPRIRCTRKMLPRNVSSTAIASHTPCKP